ncbi:MAG: hypothetical protein ABI705_13850 [Aestuariivirga sp.]
MSETLWLLEIFFGLSLLVVAVGLVMGLTNLLIAGGSAIAVRAAVRHLRQLGVPCWLASATTLFVTVVTVYLGTWFIAKATGFNFPFIAVLVVGGTLMSPMFLVAQFFSGTTFVAISYAWDATLFGLATLLLSRKCKANMREIQFL